MTTKSTTVKTVKAKAVKATPVAEPVAAPVVVREKIVNESRLVLPQDVGGFTTNFRREAARSVGRIMADPKKLAVFQELLKVFGQYAEDRYENAIVVRDKAVSDKQVQLKAAQAQALRTADGVIKSKRAQAAKLEAEIAVHDKKMEASV